MSQLSRRYASALFQAAADQNAVDAVGADLAAIDSVLADSTLCAALTSPTVAPAARAQLVAKLGEGRHQLTRNTLGVLQKRRRLAILPELREAFEIDVRASRNEVTGVVETALSLDQGQIASVEQLASKLAGGRKVFLTVKVDPSLIGGIRLQIGNTLYDGSVATELEELEKRLMEAPLS